MRYWPIAFAILLPLGISGGCSNAPEVETPPVSAPPEVPAQNKPIPKAIAIATATYPPVQIGPPPGSTPTPMPRRNRTMGSSSLPLKPPAILKSRRAIMSWEDLTPAQREEFDAELRYMRDMARWTKRIQSVIDSETANGSSLRQMIMHLSDEMDFVRKEHALQVTPRHFVESDAEFVQSLNDMYAACERFRMGDEVGGEKAILAAAKRFDKSNRAGRLTAERRLQALKDGTF